MATSEEYDVIIVGGGITGASLLYVLSSYTNVRSILLLEKYGGLAQLNSNSSNNAQTLHAGDIETNYSVEQSRHIKDAAEKVLRYSERIPAGARERVIKKVQKMVLAVGGDEVEMLDKTYGQIRSLYPGLRRIGKRELERIEPNTIKKRDPDEKVSALLSAVGYTVDFGRLTHSFVENSKPNKKVKINILFNHKVLRVDGSPGEYEVVTSKRTYRARFVVFAAGTYSLFFAKSLGYDKNLSVLSIGGNFYTTPSVLRGKVYRVQLGGIPFAAVHGDPDFNNSRITRFGPTVTLPLSLEKYHSDTFMDYMRTFDFDIPTIISLKRILLNKDIWRIISKNMVYDMPVIGKHYFLKNEASTIVPALKYSDLTFGKNIGGIRPQIIDENKKALVVGAGKIKEDGLIFNITPSPGASSCIENALEDAVEITKYIGREFNKDRFERELGRIRNENVLKLF